MDHTAERIRGDRFREWIVAIRGWPLVALLILLTSCAVQLAPSYDELINQRLTDLNQSIAAFIAGVPEAGYPARTYGAHAQFYADTLGEIEALKARAAARPVPEPLIVSWLGISSEEKKAVLGDKIPTVESLDLVAKYIEEMRTFHQGSSGLSAAFARDTGKQIQIALNNAMTYELALKR
jgi:hypothetical protein